MEVSQCHHIRIRDANEYGFDVEKYIKSLEQQFKIDLRNLPQWKEIVHRLHVLTTDCKRKIQDTNLRKKIIIDNLYMQSTRLSPFEMTDNMVRTGKKWQIIEAKNKQLRVSIKPMSEEASITEQCNEAPGEMSYSNYTAHPNTEIIPSTDTVAPPLKTDAETEINLDEPSHLPVHITINHHKTISPLASKDGGLIYKPQFDEFVIRSESKFEESLLLKQTSFVQYFPREIAITDSGLQEQTIKFAIINCTVESLNLRFKCVTDKLRFKKARVRPVTPCKLYPGLAVTFTFIFKLQQQIEQDEEFVSNLYFKLGRNVYADYAIEACSIPIVSKFTESKSVSITETVLFPSKYSWHVNGKCGYPTGVVKISVNDNNHYHLHVIKRFIDFTRSSISKSSVDAPGPNTESLVQRTEFDEADGQSKILSSSKIKPVPLEVDVVESLKPIDFISLIVDDVIDHALETFVFDKAFYDLPPHSKCNIPVYFTESEHVGYHQRLYDFEFCHPDTETVILTKEVVLLAEVLAHPIKIFPQLLDMSNSPVTHGFCEDRIVLNNTHKVYHVTVKIKLTTKMKKLFRITPTEICVPPLSKSHFVVRLCSRDFKSPKPSKDFVHFTIKIIFSGHKSVYHNVPPVFYEIIAPCAYDFKTVYNNKFYREVSYTSEDMLEMYST